jgi:hypothetical protein
VPEAPKVASEPPKQAPNGERAQNNRQFDNRDRPSGGRGAWRGNGRRGRGGRANEPRKCWNCGKVGHFQQGCPDLQENQQTVHWTYGSGITDPYDDFAIDGPAEQQVRVMDVVEFGWEDDPALDVTIDEAEEDEDYQVNMARQPGPQYLDGHGVPGVRARLPAGRQAVPVTGMVNPVQVPPGPAVTQARPPGPAPSGVQGIGAGVPALASTQIDGPRFQGTAAPTPDAGGMASSGQPPSPNVPTVTTTVNLKWIPTDVFIQHGSPSLVRDMVSTARRVGQSMTKQSEPRRVTNPAPVVRQITPSAGTTGNQEVERTYVDPMACDPIATVPARIGGVDGVEGRMDIDCGANVNVMAQQAIERAALQHKVKPGKSRFTQADGCEATSNGWIDTRI